MEQNEKQYYLTAEPDELAKKIVFPAGFNQRNRNDIKEAVEHIIKIHRAEIERLEIESDNLRATSSEEGHKSCDPMDFV